ncbi:S8 family serine peptidase [Sporosarcina ureilytica]|uniref:Peptidase S8/S53 domain-containing protein n=1 Tax=Sporosarcina ureilytica TaxID=298596 RepID=A0A1D8JJ89_9BACL|nr:S8 family serine peptidase [Sporosarcina ureilytica]AOV08765.1 hypothetical protein BI350_15250 [Sporosarcina ureilytica]
MKRFLLAFMFLMFIGFIWPPSPPNDVFGSPEQSIETEETDRMLVKVVDEVGHETVTSIATAEVAQLTEEFVVLEPDYIRSAGPFIESTQMISWGTERVGTKQMAYVIPPKKDDVIVAVIDTGVDYTHAFLRNRVVRGYDVIVNSPNAMDVHYHGTHVAGIIVDSTPSNVKVMPIRALNEEGKGYDSHLAKGIVYAVDNGAHIINMSISGEKYSNHLAAAIDYALEKDVLVVVSSGNDGANTANYYPAGEPKVIVVSATDQHDRIARFSNTGATVDLSAPGVDIISSIPSGRYASMNGTSMAAPYVSGIAAMLKLDDPTRSIQEIERLLKKYVDDRGVIGWDRFFGEGIVNVASFDERPIVKNEPPIVRLKKTSFNINKDEEMTVDLSRYVTDPEGDPLTFSADSGQISESMFHFKTEMIGQHTVTVSVTDGKSTPINFTLYIIVEAVDKIEIPDGTKSKQFKTFPKQLDTALDTEWSIKFNRELTERNIIDIKLLKGDKEVPISLTSNLNEKEIIVSPDRPYEPKMNYRLLILVEKGKSYQMEFVTID